MHTTYMNHHEIITQALSRWDAGDLVPCADNIELKRLDPRMEVTVRDDAGNVLGMLVANTQGNGIAASPYKRGSATDGLRVLRNRHTRHPWGPRGG